jgi:RimJ/RimL family protein N-acetyltransferase
MKHESWKKLWPFLKDPPVDRRNIRIEGDLVVLRSKRMEDAEADYRWRVDPELAALDATRPITITLKEYVRYHRDDLQFPSPWSVRFAVETLDGFHIGNCMYYDIDTERAQAELGIMIGNRNYWNSGYGTDAVKTLLRYIFTRTRLERVYLHTLSNNSRAQRAFEKAGFRADGQVRKDGYDFQHMEITRQEWRELQQKKADSAEAAGTNGSEASTRVSGHKPVVGT